MIDAMKLLLPALLLALLPKVASADSWREYTDNRTVSPNGKHYVVARSPEFRKLSLEICKRRDGAAPIAPAEKSESWREKEKQVSIDRDPQDALVAEAKLDWCPLDIRVLDKEPAAILFENYMGVGYGNSLACVDSKGKVRWRISLGDLFSPKDAAQFRHSVSSIWWNSGWWVDEDREKIVVIAYGDLLREVDLKDGTVETPSSKVLLTRVEKGPVADRVLALEVASRLLPDGLTPWATAVAKDEAQPLAVRLRAAIAARRAGDDMPAAEMFLQGIAKDQDEQARRFALSHLGEVMGEKAIVHLRDAMRGKAGNGWAAAQEGLAALGEAAVPALVEMLRETKESSDYRGGAAHALGRIGAPSAVPALIEAIEDPVEYVANAAANAAIGIGAPDLDAKLAALLEKGSTQDSRIASYFESHPSDLAIRPLLAALGRTKPDSFEERCAIDALAKTTGHNFGRDVQKWKDALGLK